MFLTCIRWDLPQAEYARGLRSAAAHPCMAPAVIAYHDSINLHLAGQPGGAAGSHCKQTSRCVSQPPRMLRPSEPGVVDIDLLSLLDKSTGLDEHLVTDSYEVTVALRPCSKRIRKTGDHVPLAVP